MRVRNWSRIDKRNVVLEANNGKQTNCREISKDKQAEFQLRTRKGHLKIKIEYLLIVAQIFKLRPRQHTVESKMLSVTRLKRQ